MDDAMTEAKKCYVALPDTVELPSGAEGDRWALLLSRLQLLTAMTPERRRQGHYIGLHCDYLRRLLSSRYRRRIDDMRDAGVIEIEEGYCSGPSIERPDAEPFTKEYRLQARHRHGRAMLHELTTKPAIKASRIVREVNEANLGLAGQHFQAMFGSFTMIDAAIGKTTDCWTANTLARWQSRDGFAIRCDFGRYHSLLTQTPCWARAYMVAEGSGVSIVDVSACQPLLIGYAAANRLTPPSASNHGGTAVILPYVSRFSGGWAWRDRLPNDVARWIELCEAGQFYGYFREAVLAMPGEVRTTITTDAGHVVAIDLKALSAQAFKRCTLIPVFDRLDATERTPLFAIIRRDFPTIAAYIVATKSARHQGTACLLQRLESTLMIDGCGERLRTQYPDEPVQPIHDALLVRHDFADEAAGIIRDQFARVGLRPRVKTEAIAMAA